MSKRYDQLRAEEREQMAIARALRRSHSTIRREVARIARRPGGVLPDPDRRSAQRKGRASATDGGHRDSGGSSTLHIARGRAPEVRTSMG